MEITDNNSNAQDESIVNDATIQNGEATGGQKVDPIDFKAFALAILNQYSTVGQLTWTNPEPLKVDKKLEINIVRMLDSGERQKIRITIENPEELTF